jgi:hypothetical protein
MDEKRFRSTFGFPYFDLEESIQLAKRIEDMGGSTTTQHLSADLGSKSAHSGSFKARVSSAVMLNLVKKEGNSLRTTPLVREILWPTTEGADLRARSQAFLAVPLYSQVAKTYEGRALPASDYLRNALRDHFGVSPKQVPKAFDVMLRSAEQAGVLSRRGEHSYLVPPVSLLEPHPQEPGLVEPTPSPRPAASRVAPPVPRPALREGGDTARGDLEIILAGHPVDLLQVDEARLEDAVKLIKEIRKFTQARPAEPPSASASEAESTGAT